MRIWVWFSEAIFFLVLAIVGEMLKWPTFITDRREREIWLKGKPLILCCIYWTGEQHVWGTPPIQCFPCIECVSALMNRPYIIKWESLSGVQDSVSVQHFQMMSVHSVGKNYHFWEWPWRYGLKSEQGLIVWGKLLGGGSPQKLRTTVVFGGRWCILEVIQEALKR